MAFKEETTEGTLLEPDAGSQFSALRSGAGMSQNVDQVENDELTGSRSPGGSLPGKENNTGNLPKYLKGSGSAAAPDWAVLLKSMLGGQTDNATEYDTVASSTAGDDDTRAISKVDSGEGTNFAKGHALLHRATPYQIRNVRSISSDDLSLNFNRDSAPASGVNLGRSVLFYPTAEPSTFFSAWEYQKKSSAKYRQAIAGCRITSAQFTFAANGLAQVALQFRGTKGYWNPIKITSSNKYLDMTDDGGTIAATLTEGWYNPVELAAHITAKATEASVGSGDDTITCTYDSATGKYNISSNGTTFELLWNTGTNSANSVGATIGFAVAADDDSATGYTGDNAITYSVPVTPSYDDVNPFFLKDQELLLGTFGKYSNRNCRELTITVESQFNDVEDLTAETGIGGLAAGPLTVSFSAVLHLQQHESDFHNWLKQATELEFMFNCGNKDSSRNWKDGETWNFYIPRTILTGVELGETNNIIEYTVSGRAAVPDSDYEAIYINHLGWS